jgi:Mce-associated membrane protein
VTRNAPRRPSRTTTPRPRRIAGRDEGGAEPTLPAGAIEPTVGRPATVAEPPAEPPTPDEGPTRGAGPTSTLLALLGLLVVVLSVQCAWFVWNSVRDEVVAADSSAGTSNDADEYVPISVPEGRPVQLNQLAVQEGVDAAASAAQVMFARDWKSYDKGVDSAAELMTEAFADEYRVTTGDVRREFVAKKTEVQVRVVAQSVVRANLTELEALVFLNQYVFRGEGDDAESTYTPYRALVTMVHTDKGWLVDGVDTK